MPYPAANILRNRNASESGTDGLGDGVSFRQIKRHRDTIFLFIIINIYDK
jgi:hypothetical protein